MRAAGPSLAWTAALLAAAVVLFWCYLRESQTAPVNSDGSGVALQGWQMLHGNLLLSGWWLADVTFWTVEAPLDALVEAVHGLDADVVHITAALLYMLLVLTAALLAKGKARGAEGVTRALLAAGILVAPSVSPGAQVLLLSPDHTGVGVPILLTLLLVDRARQRWWVPLAMCVLLVWAQLDDPLATYAAALPIALVCLVRALVPVVRRLHRLHGLRSLRLGRPGWYDGALAAAAAASAGLTHLAVSAVKSGGGYSMMPLGTSGHLVPYALWGHQIYVDAQNAMILFGADFYEQPAGVRMLAAILHLVGVALAVCGLLAGIVALLRRAERVTQVLTVGAVATFFGGALATQVTFLSSAHEIAVLLPYGAVLAGRTLGPWLAGRRLPRLTLTPLLGLALAGYLASLGYNTTQPPQPAQTQDVADWLVAHNLTDGLGRYWGASATTVASGGRVLVAPTQNSARIANTWVTRPSWYDPSLYYANFVIASPGAEDALAFSEAAVQRTFGPPASVYPVGQYVIMVWNKNLLLQVQKPVQG